MYRPAWGSTKGGMTLKLHPSASRSVRFLGLAVALSLTAAGAASVASASSVPRDRLGLIPHDAAATTCSSAAVGLGPLSSRFDPFTATAASLASHHYPPRPSASRGYKALAAWRTAILDAKHYVAPHAHCAPDERHWGTAQCPYDITTSTSLPCTYYTPNSSDPPWAGHVVEWTGGSNSQAPAGWDGIDYSSANWTLANPSTSYTYYFGEWTGIGLDEIIQAGTGQYDNSSHKNMTYFWYEDAPEAPVNAGPVIHPTQTAYVAIDYQGNGTSVFWLENESAQTYSEFQVNTPYYDPQSADFIIENQYEPNGNQYEIPDASIPFTNATYNGPGGTSQNLSGHNNIAFICDELNPNDGNGYTPTAASGGDFTVNSGSPVQCSP